jgi:hypothetical protein
MILNKERIVFIHAPRTSGTSIENEILKNQLVPDNQKHLRASQIKRHLENKWSDYFKFTIVRNPWDRVISFYHQIFHEAYGIRTGKSLLFFLEHYRPAPWEYGLQCSDYADEKMDLVIKFENREEGLKSLENITGIKVDPNKKSRSRDRDKKNYRDYYDEKTKDIVGKSFARDIAL